VHCITVVESEELAMAVQTSPIPDVCQHSSNEISPEPRELLLADDGISDLNTRPDVTTEHRIFTSCEQEAETSSKPELTVTYSTENDTLPMTNSVQRFVHGECLQTFHKCCKLFTCL